MRIVSLVPHTTRLMDMGKVMLSVPPSGLLGRVEVLEAKAEELDLDGTIVLVIRTRFGRVTGLPDAEPGTFYIV